MLHDVIRVPPRCDPPSRRSGARLRWSVDPSGIPWHRHRRRCASVLFLFTLRLEHSQYIILITIVLSSVTLNHILYVFAILDVASSSTCLPEGLLNSRPWLYWYTWLVSRAIDDLKIVFTFRWRTSSSTVIVFSYPLLCHSTPCPWHWNRRTYGWRNRCKLEEIHWQQHIPVKCSPNRAFTFLLNDKHGNPWTALFHLFSPFNPTSRTSTLSPTCTVACLAFLS